MSRGAWDRISARREHRWSRRRIFDYVGRDLSPAERRRLARHADGCEECRPLVRSLLRLVPALGALGSPARASVVPGVLRRLRSEELRVGPRGDRASG